MSGITRRELAGVGLAATAAATGAGSFTKTLGAQLYTVRTLMPSSADRTLKAIAEIGYKEVELDHASLLRFAPMLKQHGLKPVSCHFETPLITGNWKPWLAFAAQRKIPYLAEGATWSQAIEDAKKFGVEYMVLAYLLPEERHNFEELAEKFNRAASQAHAAGLKFCYHNHAFEFQGERGMRPIDILLGKTDRKMVGLELDVFWVSVAGIDPVEMLKQHAGRVPVVHLKDKAKGTPVMYKEGLPPETFAEVGSGALDFAAILKAAESAGVQHYFVEQDQTKGDPVASLRQSYEYLRKL